MKAIKFYVYDGEDILLELDGNNQIQAILIHAPGADNPVSMLRDENNNGKFENEELFVYTRDHLGSIREVLDSKQRVLQRYSYSSYGETKLEKISNSRQDFVDSPFGYTSREWDQETGDYYYRARYYDPGTRRFLSPDPIGFSGGDFNLYRYARNSSIMYQDPFGKTRITLDWSNAVRRVKKCKKAIEEFLKDETCSTARKINKKYECSEDWKDDLKEIFRRENYFDI